MCLLHQRLCRDQELLRVLKKLLRFPHTQSSLIITGKRLGKDILTEAEQRAEAGTHFDAPYDLSECAMVYVSIEYSANSGHC